MQPGDVRTAADAVRIVEERKLDHVKLGVFDLDGVLRGKYLNRDKFFSALENGFGFCDVVLGWDSNDQLYDNVAFTGWHTAYPDAQCRIVPDSCRALPLEGDVLFFLAEFAGTAEAVCPRGLLKRVLARAEDMGFAASAACEYEFFLFEETPHSVREKGFRNLRNITPGYFGYSVLRASVHAEFYADLLRLCTDMRFPLEGLHTETGPGVLEAAIRYADAREGADRAALFKTFVKVLAERRGLMATFMAKWSRDFPGQSGHLHVSLKDRDGRPVFHDAAAPHTISDTMRWFIGGQQALMPELLAMVAATVNSYTRLIPGFWAPTDATWGIDNRTCALRAIPGSPQSQR
ncbi:MAG TPA: glutamine synthetase, partial [Xanthobacteraceae bacterium]|nr:glutamine synthetase [Xanthobacteraceae bacterium]